MRWYFDFFFKNFFSFFIKLFFILISAIKSSLSRLDSITGCNKVIHYILYNILLGTLIKVFHYLGFFLNLLNVFFYKNFLKFYFNIYLNKLVSFIQIKTPNFWVFLQTILYSSLLQKYNSLKRNLYRFYIYVWKKFIDFLFFTLWRNRVLYLSRFKCFLFTSSMVFIFFYITIYKNTYNILFNFIFSNFLEKFSVWDNSTYSSIVLIYLSLLNVDNLFLYIYIVISLLGISNFILNTGTENFIFIGSNWARLYNEHKLDNPNFSFINHFSGDFFKKLYEFFFSFEFFSLFGALDANTPIFFYFGMLFFFTVIMSWFFFSYLGLYGIYKLNLVTLFFFWVSLLYSAKNILLLQKVYIIKLCSWVFLSLNVRIDYYFLIDTISFSFILLTTTIALFVFIYAFSYFRYEPLVDRFLLFILSFVISMLFLVSSGNTIMLFLGWELIGFTSFCLINFWTTKAATLKSAFKAFTFNKVSDFYLFMFLVASYSVYYTFDIISLNSQIYKYGPLNIYIFNTPVNFLEFLAIMIIGSAFIKSAQLGGHAWLPDSMEAPVPASSLIHSATLVSAGVYLILRFNFIFDATEYSKFLIPLIGSITAAYGGVCAVAQSDIKKTLAYSTISHCGFLMVLCATEMNEFTILYLYVHGFFKAGVFMCVGNVLRITRGYQDTRRMGGLLKYLPFEYFCATIGVLNLAGLPFTFGFFIKHLLLLSLDNHMYLYYIILFHSLIGAFAGLFYSYRLISYTFNDFKKANKALYLNSNRVSYNSEFYSNSSLAATLSIFSLFIVSYIIIFFMVKYFMFGNFLFSDYMNTTLLSNYYSVISSSHGYLLNFSFINLTVVFIILGLLFSKYRRVIRYYNMFNLIFSCMFSGLFLFIFYNFL